MDRDGARFPFHILALPLVKQPDYGVHSSISIFIFGISVRQHRLDFPRLSLLLYNAGYLLVGQWDYEVVPLVHSCNSLFILEYFGKPVLVAWVIVDDLHVFYSNLGVILPPVAVIEILLR